MPDSPSVPPSPDPIEAPEWEREQNVECVVCPSCAFTFDAIHTDTPDGGYTCPSCNPDIPPGYEVVPVTTVMLAKFTALESERDALVTALEAAGREVARLDDVVTALDQENDGYIGANVELERELAAERVAHAATRRALEAFLMATIGYDGNDTYKAARLAAHDALGSEETPSARLGEDTTG